MRSKLLDRARESLGFRLAGWYFLTFVLSAITLSIISYAFLSSSLQDNRQAIQTKLEELVALSQTTGIEGVEAAARIQGRPSRRTAFFIRLVSPDNQEVFLNAPRLWRRFAVGSILDRPAEGAWQYVPSKGVGDVLELTSAKLPAGYLLQVGRTVEGRDEILENYRNTITSVAIPMMLIALTGGALFAFRGLRPVRNTSNPIHRRDGAHRCPCSRKRAGR
jgi:hypothetical protein